jgi:hypothetical protein
MTLAAKPPLERVQENERLLERLILALPGFRGYKLKEQRREADRIVRNYVYELMERTRNDLTTCLQALIDNKLTELVESMNRLIAKTDRVAEKINHASYGYTGFFDSVKIEELDLDRMLGYDSQLMDLARKNSDMTTALRGDLTQNKLDGARNAELQLDGSISSLELAFDQRKSVIEGIKV